MLRAAVYKAEAPGHAVWQALYLADLARKRGRLALQNVTEELRDAPFLYRATIMVVDGLPAEEVERVLSRDAEASFERHQRSAGILRRAGEVAPAMGLIGTRSEEHTSEPQSLMRLPYAAFCLEKKHNR